MSPDRIIADIQHDSAKQLSPGAFVRLVSHENWQRMRDHYRLTLQELKCLQATCAGHELDGIARQLECTTKTANLHRDSLHKKLKLNDRLAIVLRVFGFLLDDAQEKPATRPEKSDG
ncbi:MAG: hypothetical protein HY040_16780 [Planctomycetes bacterium]|nr:hypothetical protein [Planctomycetota bacterium]